MPSSDVADHPALLVIAEGLARGAGELTVRLRATLSRLDQLGGTDAPADPAADRLSDATADEIFDFIDQDLGRSLSTREA